MKQIEHNEQKALFEWVQMRKATVPILWLLHAVPNGGHRSKAAAGKMKAEGVLAGIPDVHLPVPRNGWSSLYIEMKAPKGYVTPEQFRIHGLLKAANNCVEICYGWEEAARVLEHYLGCEKTV